MRVLLLIPELGYGGAETALLRLAKQLSQQHTITIAVFRQAYQQGGYANAPLPTELSVIELDLCGPTPPRLLPTKLARWWRRIRELRRLKQQHDVAISFLGGTNLLNALIRAGRPCVISERGSKRHDFGRTALMRWLWCALLDPLTYRLADRIVCVSEGLSSEVRLALPCRQRGKLITIAGYLDPEQALAVGQAAIEPELLPLAARPLLVAAGRLHLQKGFQHLLPLFAEVAPQVPRSGLLLIGDGPLQQQLVAQAIDLGLTVSVAPPGQKPNPDAQVIFLGYRPQPVRYARLGRAFVLPSLWEGLPNLLLEALAAGSWCLAADCPWGPSEIITSSSLGQLLPPINQSQHHAAWSAAMLTALSKSKQSKLPFQLRKATAERFSIANSARQWHHLMLSLSQSE